MKKTHEELERKDMIDDMLDVTKQSDLNGFYRSLYNKSLFKDNDNDDGIYYYFTYLCKPICFLFFY